MPKGERTQNKGLPSLLHIMDDCFTCGFKCPFLSCANVVDRAYTLRLYSA